MNELPQTPLSPSSKNIENHPGPNFLYVKNTLIPNPISDLG